MLQLLSFGRSFDADAYGVDTSRPGPVVYRGPGGAAVAEVVVVAGPAGRYVATQLQVCTQRSSLHDSGLTPARSPVSSDRGIRRMPGR